MIASVMNTNTPDTTIGIHNAGSPTMSTSRNWGRTTERLRLLETNIAHRSKGSRVHHTERSCPFLPREGGTNTGRGAPRFSFFWADSTTVPEDVYPGHDVFLGHVLPMT